MALNVLALVRTNLMIITIIIGCLMLMRSLLPKVSQLFVRMRMVYGMFHLMTKASTVSLALLLTKTQKCCTLHWVRLDRLVCMIGHLLS